MMSTAKERGIEWLIDQTTEFMKGLIKRDYPITNAQDEEELDMYLEYNCLKLLEELQVQFRFVTREDLELAKKELLRTNPGIVQPQIQGLQRTNFAK